jgi:hypothetical protein
MYLGGLCASCVHPLILKSFVQSHNLDHCFYSSSSPLSSIQLVRERGFLYWHALL